MKKPLHMQTGVGIGDYRFEPDNILDVVKKYKFAKENGALFNFLSIRLDKKRPTSEQRCEWAKYFHDNEIYFKISGNVPRQGERIPRLTREEIEKIQELGGEYFVGDGLGEFGGWYATKAKGYYARGVSENPVDGLRDCKEAKETYVRQIRKQMQPRIDNGSKILSSTEAVTLTPYDYEAGIDHVIFMASSKYPGNPAIFPLYKIMTKAILAASHRNSELKVIGSDKLRFAMFEDEEKEKLYIFNSDFNQKNFVTVIYKGETFERVIDSVGLEIIEFKK